MPKVKTSSSGRRYVDIDEVIKNRLSRSKPLTVEDALNETRRLFPDVQIIVSVRDCGEETTTIRGTTREYGIQIGMNGDEFDADTLAEAMEAVRAAAKG
jgi:hypothetical protein